MLEDHLKLQQYFFAVRLLAYYIDLSSSFYKGLSLIL